MNEQTILKLYAQYDSCSKVADELGTYSEAIRRVLIKHGIKRTGNRNRIEHTYKKRNRYCKAIVLMLYEVCGLTSTEIVSATHIPINSVCQIIRRKYGKCKTIKKATFTKFDIDAIENEYLAGATTYDLARKYNTDHSTISKLMIRRGHRRGKFSKGFPSAASTKSHELQRNKAIEKLEYRLKAECDGKFVLVEYKGQYENVYKCTTCGFVFSKTKIRATSYCPECKRHEQQKKNEALERKKAELLAEYEKDKVCKFCGCVFHSDNKTKAYCSDQCKKRANSARHNKSNHRKRARKYNVAYDSSITLQKLIERDNNICQICGKPCDSNDLEWGYSGKYHPSIDHIKPMSKGGSHTWDNVQLAHAICNSYKRDSWEVVA